MKKILLLSLFLSHLIASQKVEVTADSFEADELKKVSYFRGSVWIKKGSDEIKADNLKIDFDQQNRPIQYKATGNVIFKIKTDNQHFQGSSNKIIYEPTQKKYTAIGGVNIIETTKNSILKGEKITIDRISGKSKISGSKNRPVKFTFTVEEE